MTYYNALWSASVIDVWDRHKIEFQWEKKSLYVATYTCCRWANLTFQSWISQRSPQLLSQLLHLLLVVKDSHFTSLPQLSLSIYLSCGYILWPTPIVVSGESERSQLDSRRATLPRFFVFSLSRRVRNPPSNWLQLAQIKQFPHATVSHWYLSASLLKRKKFYWHFPTSSLVSHHSHFLDATCRPFALEQQ